MILDFQGKHPVIDKSVFIAPTACIIGDVEIGAGANIWFHCILRGDSNAIRVGAGCNIQDGCILHGARNRFAVVLEEDVILGHRVTAHGCHIEKGALIGIGASVLNGARVGEGAIIGAGSIVTPGSVIPPRTLALGTPAKPIRDLAEKDFAMIHQIRASYVSLMADYKGMQLPVGD